jgi:hypothetical protein
MGLLTLLTDPKNFKFYNGGQGYTGDGSTPNLKNIPYGKDRIDGGSSNQPYIQTPIPDGTSTLGVFNNDFIWRGGINAPLNSAQDVQRLTKMFIDTKTPNGLFFVTKQEALSRSAVRTQVSPNGINGGVYSPPSTLAQAGILFTGGHLPKQGINFFAGTGAYSTNENLYGVRVKPNPNDPAGSTEYNRLVTLYRDTTTNQTTNNFGFVKGTSINPNARIAKKSTPVLMSYNGGPGSPLGVGTTVIRYADQRTGVNNFQYTAKNTPSSYFWGTKTKQIAPNSFLTVGIVSGSTGLYKKLTKLTNTDVPLPTVVSGSNTINFGNSTYNVYDSIIEGNTWPDNTTLINVQNTYTYNQDDIINTSSSYATYKFSPQTQDFRAVLKSKIDQKGLTKETAIKAGQLTEAPDYTKYNIEQRVLLGDPGARANKNYSDYTKGVTEANGVNSIYPSSSAIGLSNDLNSSTQDYKASAGLDKINSLPVYRSQGVTTKTDLVNDLVKFRIAIIDNDKPAFKTFIHFRAFLGSISDSYNATWNPVQYLGRGENFYTYNGFTRQISLSWTTAAQSKEELIPMYKKLNYLASSLTPDYSSYGYMRGNIAQLTVGGYLYEVPGIITNLTYEMDESTPWEIGISTKLNENGNLYDSTVKELAHIVRVSSFNFIPIHRFRPETIEPGYMDGKQQFISLATAVSGDDKVNNYGVSPV